MAGAVEIQVDGDDVVANGPARLTARAARLFFLGSLGAGRDAPPDRTGGAWQRARRSFVLRSLGEGERGRCGRTDEDQTDWWLSRPRAGPLCFGSSRRVGIG